MRRAALFLCLCSGGVIGDGAGNRITREYYEANREALWTNFKQTHGKEYTDVNEERRRAATYHDNMQQALAMQEANAHATFGHGVFADLTEDEFAAYHTGYTPLPEETRAGLAPHEFTATQVANAAQQRAAYADPASCHTQHDKLDWVGVGAVTHVKNQGSCGGCWGFAAAGALESQWAIRGHGLASLSEQEIIECVDTCYGCSGGRPDQAFAWFTKNRDGAVTTEAARPYTLAKFASGVSVPSCPPQAALPVGARFTGQTHIRADEAELYTALVEIGPVAVAVDATSWQHYTGGVLTQCVGNRLDHGVLLVGHGYDATAGVQFWVVKNSWGPAWGEHGYIRIAYGSNQCLIAQEAGVVPNVEEAPSQAGRVPIEFSTPNDPRSAPADISHDIIDPFATKVSGEDPADAVCVWGKDCKCHGWVGATSKVGDVCGGALLALFGVITMAFAIGAIFTTLCCGVRRPRAQRGSGRVYTAM